MITTKAEIDAHAIVLDHSVITFGGVEQTNLGPKAAAFLRSQQDEIERLTETMAVVMEAAQSQTHRAIRAEARALAAEKGRDTLRKAVVPPIGDDYAYGKGWNAARKQTLERIDAALAQKREG
jgi:hypothetical protein